MTDDLKERARLNIGPPETRDESEWIMAGLLDRVEELERWQREMVEKAAASNLEGYREMGRKLETAERERDEAAARIAQLERLLRAADLMGYHPPSIEAQIRAALASDQGGDDDR